MLAYGVTTDFMDEYLKIGETTILRSLKMFIKAVVSIFSEECLKKPNNDDIARLLAVGEKYGFSDLLGNIDCMHLKWKNYPTAWHGLTPTVNYTINGNNYATRYYLANEIYPQWATFVKTISAPQGNKKKYFAAAQESVKKDVKRVFGVLQARFAIIRGPA
ncbi:uncharacterized protein LOC121257865 [Juglans microcarpa x Juglans regia]|uniref:uncharacterized protein LOC121257865 n=1 Tax=Juglans microcarpa x Juglans regia TaxID=2249226 RepID=UPI001B7F2012|nr:uncharacterized protein LOC121257865 [Juglans microcarpa x Juglans regia]